MYMKYLAPFWSCGGFRWDRRVRHICADRGNVTIPFGRITEMTPLQSRDRIPLPPLLFTMVRECVRVSPFPL